MSTLKELERERIKELTTLDLEEINIYVTSIINYELQAMTRGDITAINMCDKKLDEIKRIHDNKYNMGVIIDKNRLICTDEYFRYYIISSTLEKLEISNYHILKALKKSITDLTTFYRLIAIMYNLVTSFKVKFDNDSFMISILNDLIKEKKKNLEEDLENILEIEEVYTINTITNSIEDYNKHLKDLPNLYVANKNNIKQLMSNRINGLEGIKTIIEKGIITKLKKNITLLLNRDNAFKKASEVAFNTYVKCYYTDFNKEVPANAEAEFMKKEPTYNVQTLKLTLQKGED